VNKAAWGAFWILGFIWGSSFLLIHIGVEDIPATQLVLIRVTIAAIGLNIVRILKGVSLPRDWPTIRAFILIGGGNAAIPYTLISLGEQNISSGMAAVLQSTASLFTLIIAHFAFADERMTPRKIGGLVIGFSGVILLSSDSIEAGAVNTAILLGQLAIVVASMFYATFIVYSRRVIKRDIAPIVISSGTFIPAIGWAALFVVLEPLLGGRAFVPFQDLPNGAIMAAFGLGFFNTFIAYLFFYFIIQQLGSFRASMVTYIVPVVGLVLGALLNDEIITPAMFFGALLIFTGIGVINVRLPALMALFRRGSAEVPSV